MDREQSCPQTKYFQQPYDNNDYYYPIKDFLYTRLHRDISIDQPEQHPGNDQDYYNRYDWHG